jgi:hypothetical protein
MEKNSFGSSGTSFFYCIKRHKYPRRVDRRKMKRAKTCLKYLLKCLCLLNKQQPNKEPVYFNCFEMNPWNYITVTSPQMNKFYNLAKIKNFLFTSLFHLRIFQKCETTCLIIFYYPTSTRRHGNFAGVHTLLRILLSSNSAVLINIFIVIVIIFCRQV